MSTTPIAPVIMCTWKRVRNLPQTLAMLAEQEGVTPHLYLWNNNPAIAAEVDAAASTATIAVTVRQSPENVGGFGRFYYARELAEMYPYLIFIDDDQTLDQMALKTLLAEAKARTIYGWWAFNFDCPREFWFIEDLWLSYVAEHLHGWELYRSEAKLHFIADGKNQFAGLVREKTRFLKYLHAQGWDPTRHVWGRVGV